MTFLYHLVTLRYLAYLTAWSPSYQIQRSRVHNNLSNDDWALINNIKKNPNLIIKPADKGGALVIMDQDKYREECMHQLQACRHYRRLINDQPQEVGDKVAKYLRTCKVKKEIHSRITDYLIPKAPRKALFYILPKIHKVNNLGHRIISANECPMEKNLSLC